MGYVEKRAKKGTPGQIVKKKERKRVLRAKSLRKKSEKGPPGQIIHKKERKRALRAKSFIKKSEKGPPGQIIHKKERKGPPGTIVATGSCLCYVFLHVSRILLFLHTCWLSDAAGSVLYVCFSTC